MNKCKLSVCSMILALAAAGAASQVSAAEYYRWTDENGVVHMSDKRPENRQVEVVKPRPPTPMPLAEQARKAEEEAREEAEEKAAEQEAPQAVDPNAPKDLRCQQERERLEILEANEVVHMQDANGNLKTLTPAEIQKEIAVTQKAIDFLCNP